MRTDREDQLTVAWGSRGMNCGPLYVFFKPRGFNIQIKSFKKAALKFH